MPYRQCAFVACVREGLVRECLLLSNAPGPLSMRVALGRTIGLHRERRLDFHSCRSVHSIAASHTALILKGGQIAIGERSVHEWRCPTHTEPLCGFGATPPTTQRVVRRRLLGAVARLDGVPPAPCHKPRVGRRDAYSRLLGLLCVSHSAPTSLTIFDTHERVAPGRCCALLAAA